MARKDIGVSDRAYEWSSMTRKPAPWPRFDRKKVNVKLILHEERPKDYEIWIEDNKEGYVNWLTQDSESPSEEFNEEIIRAFKANGLKKGAVIHVEYKMRGNYNSDEYDLTIQ